MFTLTKQMYSNPQLNSLISSKLSANGLLKWELQYNPEDIVGYPKSLLLLDDKRAVLDHADVFFAIDLEMKKILGMKTKSDNSHVAIGGEGQIYFVRSLLYRQYFDSLQSTTDYYDVHGFGEYSYLSILIPGVSSYITGVQTFITPSYRESSFIIAERNYVPGATTIWNVEFPGSGPIPPVSPRGEIVLAQEGIMRIITKEGEVKVELGNKFIPLMVSIGPDNLIYMICIAEDGVRLRALDFNGDVRWESATSIKQPNQPPIISDDSKVFIIGNSKIEAMLNGEMLWDFMLTGNDEMSQLASVTMDGLLLVLDGNKLICLDDGGHPVWTYKDRENEIFRTQPVMDSNGNVFIVTENKIVALK